MNDVEDESRVLRWSHELRSLRPGRVLAGSLALPSQRTALDDVPPTAREA